MFSITAIPLLYNIDVPADPLKESFWSFLPSLTASILCRYMSKKLMSREGLVADQSAVHFAIMYGFFGIDTVASYINLLKVTRVNQQEMLGLQLRLAEAKAAVEARAAVAQLRQ